MESGRAEPRAAAPSTGRRVDPLEEALEAQLVTFHRLTTKIWLLFYAAGVLVAGIVAAFVSASLGLACAAIACTYLLWNLWLYRRLERGPAGPRMSTFVEVVEGMAPWLLMIAMVAVKGPQYALASWAPPMFFVGLVLMHVLRLRRWTPLVVGAASAVTLLVLYFGTMWGRMPAVYEANLVYQPSMQITRALSLLLAGFIASIASQYHRQVILRAGIQVRERELFGKYRLLERIAHGGMGTVFDALYCPEGGFERRVAVKRIHGHLSEQARFVRLFREEAELCSRLAHPNIVQVLDFGRVDGAYFLAMEYVDGITLSTLARRASREGIALSPGLVGSIGRELLAALHHAHEQARGTDGQPLHVVHRDVCPQNVLVSVNGLVKLTDFGVARALRDTASSHTQTVVGHLAYMAPEQAKAEAHDARVDLFGLGVMLWELLTGQRLFDRGVDTATLHALIYDEVPPVVLGRDDLDPAWDTLLRRALSRDPARRFPSARAMLEALDAIPSSRSDTSTVELAELVRRFMETPEGDAGREADTARDTRTTAASPDPPGLSADAETEVIDPRDAR